MRPFGKPGKSLIPKRFASESLFMWITLLIASRGRRAKPAKSRVWLRCPEKAHLAKLNKINDLRALLFLQQTRARARNLGAPQHAFCA
jgi:hypothetical protein